MSWESIKYAYRVLKLVYLKSSGGKIHVDTQNKGKSNVFCLDKIIFLRTDTDIWFIIQIITIDIDF